MNEKTTTARRGDGHRGGDEWRLLSFLALPPLLRHFIPALESNFLGFKWLSSPFL